MSTPHLGVRPKLFIGVAALISGFVGFFALYTPSEQRATAQHSLATHAASLSGVLASLVAPALEFDQPDDAQARLSSLANEEDLGYAVVLKPDGSRFAAYRRAEFDSALIDATRADARRIVERGGYLHVTTPITSKGNPVGSLVVGFSMRQVEAAHARSRGTALMVGAVILVVGLIVAWLIGRSIAKPLTRASQQLERVSTTLVAAAREQEASAAQEAAAVAETRQSMETLLSSAQRIADSSSAVLGNAERSMRGSQEIAGRIGDLDSLSEKVAEILASIMQVADKTDLLALNAALEGTKAGESGKGFALVAAEMRRLAENVMESVQGIRELMREMRSASQAAVAASDQGVGASGETTQSAREIALVTQEQRQATEQVIASMDEMSHVLRNTLEGIKRTNTAADDLASVAATLSALVSAEGKARTEAAGLRRRQAAGAGLM